MKESTQLQSSGNLKAHLHALEKKKGAMDKSLQTRLHCSEVTGTKWAYHFKQIQ